MIKKILFCTPSTSAFTKPVLKAFVRLGYDTKIFDYQKGNLLSRGMGLTLNKLKLNNKSLQTNVNSYINNQLVNTVKNWKPDIVFVIKGQEITLDSLVQIKSYKSLLVNWYPDWMILWDWIKTYSPFYDYFFNMCDDVEHILCKSHLHTAFIPPAANPDAAISIMRYLPITFIGQYTPRRERFFTKISDLGLRIWGYSKWQTGKLKTIASSSINNKQCLDIIRKSKITVNILTGTDSFEPDAINVRTFEALGTGTFLLVQDQRLLHKYFKPGKDFVTFKTPTDLRTKAIYYLEHDKERNAIAQRGWYTVRTYHTYDIRLKHLLKYIDA